LGRFRPSAAESLGIPLPGETALIIAAAYAGRTHRLSPWIIFAVASAAAVTGDNIGFWIGRRGGYRLARKHGHKVRLDERKLKIARYLFDRYGGKVVFFGRFVSVLRTYAAFLADASKMAWHKFLPANAFGGIAWAGIYTLAAYLAALRCNRHRPLSTGPSSAPERPPPSRRCSWSADMPARSPTAPRPPTPGRWNRPSRTVVTRPAQPGATRNQHLRHSGQPLSPRPAQKQGGRCTTQV
jgi:membrane protein DedA with SNARE-associated domain